MRQEETVLLVVDYQEKLMPVMEGREELEQNAIRLIRGIQALELPVLVTQQYTKGLGATVPAIGEALGDYGPIEKISFSCFGQDGFKEALLKTGRHSVLLAGIETHICVAQTGLDLLDAGFDVFLVLDAISSRKSLDTQGGIQRLVQAGAVPVTVEGVLFELLGNAKAPAFKEISGIIK